MDKKCMIAGLPSAGKSTYMAALWAIEKEGGTDHELTCAKYPTGTSYLDSLRKKWQSMELVDRTTVASPAEIELTMRVKKTGKEMTLLIPDFKGEVFQQVLTNVINGDVERWCEQSGCILFFMRDLKPMTLQDEIPSSEEDRDVEQKQEVRMELKDIPIVIQNVMLLKYLHQMMGSCRIAVCISAWDAIDNFEEGDCVENWVRKNHPFLYQYVKAHFQSPLFYGVSAQGCDYESAEFEQEVLLQKTIDRRRAYVCQTATQNYDITQPLAALLNI